MEWAQHVGTAEFGDAGLGPVLSCPQNKNLRIVSPGAVYFDAVHPVKTKPEGAEIHSRACWRDCDPVKAIAGRLCESRTPAEADIKMTNILCGSKRDAQKSHRPCRQRLLQHSFPFALRMPYSRWIAFAWCMAGIPRNSETTASGTLPSTCTTAMASSGCPGCGSPPLRPNEKFAMLIPCFPRIVPTFPITPGTSWLRRYIK